MNRRESPSRALEKTAERAGSGQSRGQRRDGNGQRRQGGRADRQRNQRGDQRLAFETEQEATRHRGEEQQGPEGQPVADDLGSGDSLFAGTGDGQLVEDAIGPIGFDSRQAIVRLTDSIQALLTALGPRAFTFLCDIARLTQPARVE